MIKPILWTVVALIAIILTFMSGNTTIWAYVIVATAAACAVLQWMVWKRNK